MPRSRQAYVKPNLHPKQSQFPPGQQEGQVLCGKGVMVNRTFDRPRQNKATFGGWAGRTIAKAGGLDDATRHRGKHAKQSQFGTSRARACPELAEGTPNPRRDNCAKQTQFPASAGRDGAPGVWDEGQMRKTNPIWQGVSSLKFQVLRRARPGSGFKLHTLHFRLGRGPFVQNEPNSRPHPRIGVQSTDG